jgi:two-component sensor histidine kinase
LIRRLRNNVNLTTNALSRVALGLAMAAIIVGLVIWTWLDFADARSDGEARVSSAAAAMSDLARSSLATTDRVIESVVARINEIGLDGVASESERVRLRRFANSLPETGALLIFDKAGDAVAAAPLVLPAPVHVGDREWFRAVRDETVGIYVGRALQSRAFHDLRFPIAGSIWGPEGSFIGAVDIELGMGFLAHLFRSLHVGTGATVSLYRTTDGAVAARYPISEALLDESMATLPYFSELARSDIQSWMGWIKSGGESQLVSARRLSNWPLIVSVSLPKNEIYADAWRRLLWRSAFAAVTLAGLLALTALVARQARREAMLVGELDHRVKNVLATVSAIMTQTQEASGSRADFVTGLNRRIYSLARTHELLSESNWRGASLAEIVRREFAPYAAGNAEARGPSVTLKAEATQAVATVLHELTTNAAKYGAFSNRTGRVSVLWRRLQNGSRDRLVIEWQETGGPPVLAPSRSGYGTSIIRELIPFELGGAAELSFAPEGTRCRLEIPGEWAGKDGR